MENENPVYGRTVIEFVAVANEYCKYAEQAAGIKGDELLRILQRILPLLYIKASLLPALEPYFEEGNEKFVTENDYNRIRDLFKRQFGKADDYYELTEGITGNIGEATPVTISENLADIYQDIKDFLLLYRTGTDEVMNDAVWECKMNFETIWGRKIVGSMVAIHRFIYSGETTEPDDDEIAGTGEANTDEWLVSKRQKDFRENGE